MLIEYIRLKYLEHPFLHNHNSDLGFHLAGDKVPTRCGRSGTVGGLPFCPGRADPVYLVPGTALAIAIFSWRTFLYCHARDLPLLRELSTLLPGRTADNKRAGCGGFLYNRCHEPAQWTDVSRHADRIESSCRRGTGDGWTGSIVLAGDGGRQFFRSGSLWYIALFRCNLSGFTWQYHLGAQPASKTSCCTD